MKEDALHFIWKYLLFDISKLKTTYGEPLEIIKNGTHNHNQGADFSQAHIKINDILYIGNVELHLKNEDWYRHRHAQDPRYDNTILHVVLHSTNEIYTLNSSNHSIPILVLENYIASKTMESLDQLILSKQEFPCKSIAKIPEKIYIESFKSKLIVERLEEKSSWIFQLFQSNNKHIESTFYQIMLYGFGLKINSTCFLEIAKSIPLTVLAKHSNDLFQLEALLLGQANLLDSTDDYALKLRNEYIYLRQVHRLQPIHSKPLFSKLMPPSFPTIRLAQFAAFIHNQQGLYSKLIELKTLEELKPFFDIKVSEYWHSHYNFGKEHSRKSMGMTREFINKIAMNILIPMLYTMDKYLDKEQSTAIEMLSQLPNESNSILNKMTQNFELENKNAYDSQSILEWNKNYCKIKKCIDCPIGYFSLKQSKIL